MKKVILINLIFSLISILSLTGQISRTDTTLSVVDTIDNNFGLFEKEEILRLALRFDVRQYVNRKPQEEYMNALLTYFISDKDSINKEVKIKSRGVVRNDICDFPPLMLNIKNAGFGEDDMKKIEKIKIVTHCDYGNEKYLFREYLVYKLYNILTDYSFRVRLAKIDYINTARDSKPIKTYCFLIEPLEVLASRIGSEPITTPNLTQKHIIPSSMDRMAIFNYMIGNTDWSVPNLHNCKILSGTDFNFPGLGIIVPYDFDYSGLVNASYAVPYDGLGLRSVRDRRYLGVCRNREDYAEALKEFIKKKSELYRVINEFPLLNEKEKKELTKYLDEFYIDVEKNRILYSFEEGCIRF
jgi:hypothetical protein